MFYSFTCFLIGIVARIFFSIRIIDHENIPKEGAVIIAANHLSNLDIPFLAYSIGRGADFMGKKELFNVPLFGYLLRMLNGFPVDREKIDRAALREAVKRLKTGRVLVIYPEGRRSPDGTLQPGKPGVGMLVRMSGAKVIPAAIIGTDKAMPRGSWFMKPVPVTIKFGKPIDFNCMAENTGEKGDVVKITKIIMDKIGELQLSYP